MSSIAPSPALPPPTENDQPDEKRLRARARRRAMFCPGAGWALLGYGKRGALVLATFAVCWMAVAWMLWTLSPASLWAAGIATLIALAAWVVELFDIGWCLVRARAESALVRRFAVTTLSVGAMVLAVPLLIVTRFGAIAVMDDRMAPSLEPGERLIYHRHVAEHDLKEGTVVVYRLPPRNKVGVPGELTIARILAMPDDELSVQNGHYVVNRQVSRHRAQAAPFDAPIKAPSRPKALTVPEDRYFVVHDSASTGIDGQQLGWVRRGDLVSTRLFHFGGRGVLRPVE